MDGWIKLHRKLTQWQWYKNPVVKVVFIHLLLICNHQTNTWNDIVIEKRTGCNFFTKYSKRYGLRRSAS